MATIFTASINRCLLFAAFTLLLSGCAVESDKTSVTPKDPVPVAGFTITNNDCTANCEVIFTNTSQNATGYQWSFGDGSVGSTSKDAKWTYLEGGTYLVTLVATGPGGSQTVSQKVTIQPGKIRWYMRFPTMNTLDREVMTLIEGGTFQMGDTRNEPLVDLSEQPVHSVTVNNFYLATYEVSQRQWKAIMGTNPSFFNDCDECPVENVSWDDIQRFLDKLNQQRIAGTPVFRLPTEAEWEYAAGGGRTLKARFGNGTNILNPTQANFDGSIPTNYSVVGSKRGKTTYVGSFKPNSLLLYDMSGNVAEFCSDYYGAYENKPQTNPTGPANGSSRVFRGGSWWSAAGQCRVSYRYAQLPFNKINFIGFRIASDAK